MMTRYESATKKASKNFVAVYLAAAPRTLLLKVGYASECLSGPLTLIVSIS